MGKKQSLEGKTRFEETLEKLEKSYGKGTVLTLESKVGGVYDVISTGSIGLDWLTLGVGGWVKGRMYEVMGWEGTSKSTICAHAVAECQKMGGTALYIDGEHAVDKNYFQAIGVDTSKMLIAQPSSGEEGFSIAIEMIKTGNVDLVIIDSDSSLIPKVVIDGEMGESAIGKKARLNNEAYPKIKGLLSTYKTCVIIISQYREKIGVMYGNPTTTQGGHALKFYTDCRLEFSKTALKEGDVNYADSTKVNCKKNKLAPPFRKSTFEVVYGKGIDKEAELFELGLEYDVIIKSASWFSYRDSKIGQGKALTIQMLRDNPELFEEIKKDVIEKIRNLEIEEVVDELQDMREEIGE